MVDLSAVHPDWVRILDSDVEGREGSRAICDGHETRIEALHIRGKLELAARITEGGLRNRVILRSELENLLGFISTTGTFSKTSFTYDGILGFGRDELRVVGKGAIGTHRDGVLSACTLNCCASSGGRRIRSSIGGSRTSITIAGGGRTSITIAGGGRTGFTIARGGGSVGGSGLEDEKRSETSREHHVVWVAR